MTVINMGNNILSFTEVMFNMVPFFIASWEEYHTGIFVLGYINGPEDGIFMVYMSYLFAVITGILHTVYLNFWPNFGTI